MSDANVGARRGRNIRNHLFIANGILNSVKNKELQKVDVQIYDLKQAFDSLWIQDIMNDLYDVSEVDDKISLLIYVYSPSQIYVWCYLLFYEVLIFGTLLNIFPVI